MIQDPQSALTLPDLLQLVPDKEIMMTTQPMRMLKKAATENGVMFAILLSVEFPTKTKKITEKCPNSKSCLFVVAAEERC